MAPMATDPEPLHGDMRGDTWDTPRERPGAPMETDPQSAHVGMQLDIRDAPPPATGRTVKCTIPRQKGRRGSNPNPATPDYGTGPQPRPFRIWFFPMPRCARREGASPTGWNCLQSLVYHLRSVRLSTGAAPPDAWLDTHGLRVCLACREITPQGARCPGPRCSTAMLAALALGITAPPAEARSPLAGPLRAGLGLVHLLGTRIYTLRRVLIAASTTCARALTCLLQALERKQTWETLARLLLFPRITLADPAPGGKATRSSSTQLCRLNCLAAVMKPLGERIARIHRQAATHGPRTGAQSRVAAPETAAASPQASDRTGAALPAPRGGGTCPPTPDVRWCL